MLLKEWGERVGLIEIASNNSVWRGMDYYENKKVLSWHKAEDGTYNGVVSGQEGKDYSVHIDKIHPRKSTCNCPFADGRRVVCKHMIALYFTAEPETKSQGLFHQIHKQVTFCCISLRSSLLILSSIVSLAFSLKWTRTI